MRKSIQGRNRTFCHPCVSTPEEGGIWHDHFSSMPFASRWLRGVHDLLDPFTGPSLLDCRYHFGAGATVCGELVDDAADSHVPRSLEVQLAPRQLATFAGSPLHG